MAREAFIPNDARFTEAERVLLVTGPNMAGQVHHPPADRPLRGAGPDGRVRPRGGGLDRRGGPAVHPRGRERQPGAGAVHLHGGDERDQRHPPQRDRAEPGAARRDRARHLHLRRRRDRVGGHRAPARPGRLQDDVRHPLPRADAAPGAAAARAELQRRRPGDRRHRRLPPPAGAGRHRPLVRHPRGAARGAARRGGGPGPGDPRHARGRAPDGSRRPAAAGAGRGAARPLRRGAARSRGGRAQGARPRRPHAARGTQPAGRASAPRAGRRPAYRGSGEEARPMDRAAGVAAALALLAALGSCGDRSVGTVALGDHQPAPSRAPPISLRSRSTRSPR